jgi:hypothetical protein
MDSYIPNFWRSDLDRTHTFRRLQKAPRLIPGRCRISFICAVYTDVFYLIWMWSDLVWVFLAPDARVTSANPTQMLRAPAARRARNKGCHNLDPSVSYTFNKIRMVFIFYINYSIGSDTNGETVQVLWWMAVLCLLWGMLHGHIDRGAPWPGCGICSSRVSESAGDININEIHSQLPYRNE